MVFGSVPNLIVGKMYQGRQEHDDHVFGAQYDDIRERYASEIEDLKADDRMYEYEMEYRQKVHDAGFGDDIDAYEAYWKRTLEYYTQLGY